MAKLNGNMTITIVTLADDEELVVETAEERWVPYYGSAPSNTQYRTTTSVIRRRKRGEE